jgi:pyruvate dehydrogenase complex dehydrogenase (E1) component
MLTIEDVASHWGLRPAAVRARIAAGHLRAFRIAGRHRTTWADVWACEAGPRPTGALADRYKTPLMTKSDLSRAMRVSVRTVERWMTQGLPTRAIGTNTRFNRAETASWLRARFGVDGEQLLVAGLAAKSAA